MLKNIKEKFSNYLNISLLQQTSKGKKCRFEGLNMSSGNTLAIIDSDFTVDIDDSIAAIMESTKNEIFSLIVLVPFSQWKKMQ